MLAFIEHLQVLTFYIFRDRKPNAYFALKFQGQRHLGGSAVKRLPLAQVIMPGSGMELASGSLLCGGAKAGEAAGRGKSRTLGSGPEPKADAKPTAPNLVA